MAGTRSSQRLNSSSSPATEKTSGGTKRKAEDTSATPTKSKRGRPSKASKEQKTLEETIPATGDTETEEAEANGDTTNGNDHVDENEEKAVANGATKENGTEESGETGTAKAEETNSKGEDASAFDRVKADEGDAGKTGKEEIVKENEPAEVNEDAIEEDKNREKAMPSNVLEKGIIYFFARGRVGVDDPDSVQDLARSYFVLRPLSPGAKITEGAVQDIGNNRLMALPKKVWPKSGKDRFMTFVEKAKVSMETLKEEFFAGSEYTTKTTGTRHTPDVTPLGEGVYAMTSTGGGQGTTHLAYMLTIPTELGEVQKDVGLSEKGSFILSVKNPESSGPANVQLSQGAEYSKEIMEEFGSRNWIPARPSYLDYNNGQILLIGENFDSSANLDPAPKDEKDDAKETPQEELEKLEHEDELRIERLKGDDTVFADLGISSKEYPKVMTTW